MLPLKLVRSLVLGETITNHPLLLPHHHYNNHNDNNKNNDQDHQDTTKTRTKIPFLLFLPTNELVRDTYRLATIAREMGMDLYPTPSLSNIIFSYPSSLTSSPSSSTTSPLTPCTSTPSTSSAGGGGGGVSWSSTSSLLYLPDNAIPLSFPSLSSSSTTNLRSFVSISKGLFKLVFLNSKHAKKIMGGFESESLCNSNWDCCTFSLFWRVTGDRIDSMDAFSRALAGVGWTLFKSKKNDTTASGGVGGSKMVYLFRKVDSKPAYLSERDGGGQCRVKELRLPTLDFRNAPLRILHYILLMTDDVFYLA